MSATMGIAPGRSGRPLGRFGRSASRLGRSVGQRFGGIMAIGVKELRGRMRGRRAFVVLTVYLTLIAGVAWMIESIAERSLANSFGGSSNVSAQIGQGIFAALLVLEMVIVIVLAPSFTAGAISLEREKQTIDLLITTPISSLAIVLGKLFSALVYLFLVIVASVPLTALVFVYGGAGPEDLVKGYVVLLVTAFGLGSVGVFCSSLARRTQPATVITYALVLLVTFGTGLVWVFWGSLGNQASVISSQPQPADGSIAVNPVVAAPARPPEALLWLNPFVSIVDVFCGTETGFGGTCSIIATVTGRDPNVLVTGGAGANFGGGAVAGPAPAQIVKGGVIVNGGGVLAPVPVPVAAAPGAAFGVAHDTFWPHAALAWLVVSFVLIVASVQMVSPTRRWRPGWPFRRRRATAATAIGGPATHPTVGPATVPGADPDPTAAPDPETTPAGGPGPEGAEAASS
jgi:ABC-type transport system involved in multi-copper enzyme maturation permease subunit